MELQFLTIPELSEELGRRVRAYRLRHGIEQSEVARIGGLTERTVRTLEQGGGSSLETLLRVMKALGTLDGLDHLFPMAVSIDPLAMLKRRTPQRASRKRGPRGA